MTIMLAGSTSKTVYFWIVEDAGATNPGDPKTGMAFGDVTSASYARDQTARVAITPATQTAGGVWTVGGFAEVDATNMPGLYRFDIPDLAIATGTDKVTIHLLPAGAQNAITEPVEITLNVEDTVWDAPGSSHLVAGSMGEKMAAFAPIQTFVEASPTPTATIFAIDDITMTDDTMIDATLVFIDGDLIGQARRITGNVVNGTNVLTFTEPWQFEGSDKAPASTDRCVVVQGADVRGIADVIWDETYSDHIGGINTFGQAIAGLVKTSALHQNAGSGTFTALTFSTGLTEANDFWNGQVVMFTTGTNAGISRRITDFVNTNGQVTVSPAFPNTTAASERFCILGPQTLPGIINAIWDELLSAHSVAGSSGKALDDIIADVTQVALTPELAAVPSSTPTLEDAIKFLYMAARNKVITDSGAGNTKIHNDAGTAIATATVTDAASVFTRDKYA